MPIIKEGGGPPPKPPKLGPPAPAPKLGPPAPSPKAKLGPPAPDIGSGKPFGLPSPLPRVAPSLYAPAAPKPPKLERPSIPHTPSLRPPRPAAPPQFHAPKTAAGIDPVKALSNMRDAQLQRAQYKDWLAAQPAAPPGEEQAWSEAKAEVANLPPGTPTLTALAQSATQHMLRTDPYLAQVMRDTTPGLVHAPDGTVVKGTKGQDASVRALGEGMPIPDSVVKPVLKGIKDVISKGVSPATIPGLAISQVGGTQEGLSYMQALAMENGYGRDEVNRMNFGQLAAAVAHPKYHSLYPGFGGRALGTMLYNTPRSIGQAFYSIPLGAAQLFYASGQDIRDLATGKQGLSWGLGKHESAATKAIAQGMYNYGGVANAARMFGNLAQGNIGRAQQEAAYAAHNFGAMAQQDPVTAGTMILGGVRAAGKAGIFTERGLRSVNVGHLANRGEYGKAGEVPAPDAPFTPHSPGYPSPHPEPGGPTPALEAPLGGPHVGNPIVMPPHTPLEPPPAPVHRPMTPLEHAAQAEAAKPKPIGPAPHELTQAKMQLALSEARAALAALRAENPQVSHVFLTNTAATLSSVMDDIAKQHGLNLDEIRAGEHAVDHFVPSKENPWLSPGKFTGIIVKAKMIEAMAPATRAAIEDATNRWLHGSYTKADPAPGVTRLPTPLIAKIGMDAVHQERPLSSYMIPPEDRMAQRMRGAMLNFKTKDALGIASHYSHFQDLYATHLRPNEEFMQRFLKEHPNVVWRAKRVPELAKLPYDDLVHLLNEANDRTRLAEKLWAQEDGLRWAEKVGHPGAEPLPGNHWKVLQELKEKHDEAMAVSNALQHEWNMRLVQGRPWTHTSPDKINEARHVDTRQTAVTGYQGPGLYMTDNAQYINYSVPKEESRPILNHFVRNEPTTWRHSHDNEMRVHQGIINSRKVIYDALPLERFPDIIKSLTTQFKNLDKKYKTDLSGWFDDILGQDRLGMHENNHAMSFQDFQEQLRYHIMDGEPALTRISEDLPDTIIHDIWESFKKLGYDAILHPERSNRGHVHNLIALGLDPLKQVGDIAHWDVRHWMDFIDKRREQIEHTHSITMAAIRTISDVFHQYAAGGYRHDLLVDAIQHLMEDSRRHGNGEPNIPLQQFNEYLRGVQMEPITSDQLTRMRKVLASVGDDKPHAVDWKTVEGWGGPEAWSQKVATVAREAVQIALEKYGDSAPHLARGAERVWEGGKIGAPGLGPASEIHPPTPGALAWQTREQGMRMLPPAGGAGLGAGREPAQIGGAGGGAGHGGPPQIEEGPRHLPDVIENYKQLNNMDLTKQLTIHNGRYSTNLLDRMFEWAHDRILSSDKNVPGLERYQQRWVKQQYVVEHGHARRAFYVWREDLAPLTEAAKRLTPREMTAAIQAHLQGVKPSDMLEMYKKLQEWSKNANRRAAFPRELREKFFRDTFTKQDFEKVARRLEGEGNPTGASWVRGLMHHFDGHALSDEHLFGDIITNFLQNPRNLDDAVKLWQDIVDHAGDNINSHMSEFMDLAREESGKIDNALEQHGMFPRQILDNRRHLRQDIVSSIVGRKIHDPNAIYVPDRPSQTKTGDYLFRRANNVNPDKQLGGRRLKNTGRLLTEGRLNTSYGNYVTGLTRAQQIIRNLHLTQETLDRYAHKVSPNQLTYDGSKFVLYDAHAGSQFKPDEMRQFYRDAGVTPDEYASHAQQIRWVNPNNMRRTIELDDPALQQSAANDHLYLVPRKLYEEMATPQAKHQFMSTAGRYAQFATEQQRKLQLGLRPGYLPVNALESAFRISYFNGVGPISLIRALNPKYRDMAPSELSRTTFAGNIGRTTHLGSKMPHLAPEARLALQDFTVRAQRSPFFGPALSTAKYILGGYSRDVLGQTARFENYMRRAAVLKKEIKEANLQRQRADYGTIKGTIKGNVKNTLSFQHVDDVTMEMLKQIRDGHDLTHGDAIKEIMDDIYRTSGDFSRKEHKGLFLLAPYYKWTGFITKFALWEGPTHYPLRFLVLNNLSRYSYNQLTAMGLLPQTMVGAYPISNATDQKVDDYGHMDRMVSVLYTQAWNGFSTVPGLFGIDPATGDIDVGSALQRNVNSLGQAIFNAATLQRSPGNAATDEFNTPLTTLAKRDWLGTRMNYFVAELMRSLWPATIGYDYSGQADTSIPIFREIPKKQSFFAQPSSSTEEQLIAALTGYRTRTLDLTKLQEKNMKDALANYNLIYKSLGDPMWYNGTAPKGQLFFPNSAQQAFTQRTQNLWAQQMARIQQWMKNNRTADNGSAP